MQFAHYHDFPTKSVSIELVLYIEKKIDRIRSSMDFGDFAHKPHYTQSIAYVLGPNVFLSVSPTKSANSRYY